MRALLILIFMMVSVNAWGACPPATNCPSPTYNQLTAATIGAVAPGSGAFSTFNVGNSGPFVTPHSFQVGFALDPSTLPADTRQSVFFTTLNYGTTTTNIWENLNSFLYVNGPGVAQGEINLIHAFLQVNAGAQVNQEENFESSAINNGIIGGFDGYLAIFDNGSAGTVTGALAGFTTYLTNTNHTPGSILEWDGLNVTVMQGGGSQPTFYNAVRVADLNAGIVTLGGINIGTIGNAIPNVLFIQGQDNNGAIFPFVFRNLAGSVFAFNDAGFALFQAAGVTIGPNTGGVISIAAPNNSGGNFSLDIKNLAATDLLNVSNSGVVGFGAAGITIGPNTGGVLTITDPDNNGGHFSINVTSPSGNLFALNNLGFAVFTAAGLTIGPNTGGILSIAAPDNTAGHYSMSLKNLANAVLFAVDDSGAIFVNGGTGATKASCVASGATFTITNGLITGIAGC